MKFTWKQLKDAAAKKSTDLSDDLKKKLDAILRRHGHSTAYKRQQELDKWYEAWANDSVASFNKPHEPASVVKSATDSNSEPVADFTTVSGFGSDVGPTTDLTLGISKGC